MKKVVAPQGLETNVPLKAYTTFKIGGPAKYFFSAKTKNELVNVMKWARKERLPYFILGGGSNLLVSSKGFDGIVIKFDSSDFKFSTDRVYADSGVELSKVVSSSIKKGFAGLEWCAGIPGKVGGAIRGNISAFGYSIGSVVNSVEILDREDNIRKLTAGQCEFSYKTSKFKKDHSLVILSAEFILKKGDQEDIEKRAKDYLDYRKNTHPHNLPSAGCVFKNTETEIRDPAILEKYPKLKRFNQKGIIPSSYLIDCLGLKGKRIGGAKISEKHANFIVNLGNASSEDVLGLIKLMRQRVKDEFGITLEIELQYLS